MAKRKELMPQVEFTKKAIKNLRNDGYKGIHSVYSGFNAAFREYYNDDPVAATKKMQEEGHIVVIPRKGGALLYLPGDAPVADKSAKARETLNKVLGA